MEEKPPTIRQALRDTANFIFVMFGIIGWIWFASMVFLKTSGATIYATTEQSVIQAMDPVWDEAAETSILDAGVNTGLHFNIKIQGVQPDEAESTPDK